MAQGWIKLHREADEHPCLQKFDAQGVWDKLLMRAARAPRPLIRGGQSIILQRGQLAVSVSAFAEEGGITRKRMRSILGLFRANEMITLGQAKGHAFTIITICNYDEYQSPDQGEGQGQGQPEANEGPTKGQARANEGPTNKQERENPENPLTPNVESDSPPESHTAPAKPSRRARSEYPPEFEELWSTYPRRNEDDKAGCLKHWRAVTRTDEPRAILKAAVAYYGEHHDNEFRFGLRRWLSARLYRNPVPKRRQSHDEDVIGEADRMSKDIIRKMSSHDDESQFAGTHSVVPDRPAPGVWDWPEDDGRALVVAERPLH